MCKLVSFDGSFEGFLSLLYFVKKNNITPSNIITTNTPLSLFDEPIFIKTDIQNAKTLYTYLKDNLPKKAFRAFCCTFLHDSSSLHVNLFQYSNIKDINSFDNIIIEPIKSIEKAYRYILKERHRMFGFIRFSKLSDGVYYAQCEPKNNILTLLGTHFSNRFKHEWIIHDTKRDLALLHNNGSLSLKNVESFQTPQFHEEELACKKLWQSFFTSVAISSRKNHKAQRQLVPLFYRPFMDEFNGF